MKAMPTTLASSLCKQHWAFCEELARLDVHKIGGIREQTLFPVGLIRRVPPAAAAVKGMCTEALNQMQANSATYASVLRWCGNSKALIDGKHVHVLVIKNGLDRSVFIVSLLVQMYGNCGAFRDALSLFGDMHEKNVFSWNFIIRAGARRGENEMVLAHFKQMQEEGVLPNKVTFVSIFDACAHNEATLTLGEQMHALILGSAFESDVVIGTALVNMYGTSGCLQDAIKIFNKLPERDAIAWTALISVFSQHGQGREALQLFNRMFQEGVMPNNVTFVNILNTCATQAALHEGERIHARISKCGFESDIIMGNALINMYGKCERLEEADMIFQNMVEHNVVSWTAMIAMYSHNGHSKEALQLFDQMQQSGVLPDNITFTTILAACACSIGIADCKHVHTIILEQGLETDVVVGTNIVNMYGKHGVIESARLSFNEIADRNIFSWNAMIAAYTQNGHDKKALDLFNQMQHEGMVPNKVTFVSILDACASLSALVEGEQMHARILQSTFEQELDLKNALVYMYGKCGRLESAKGIFDNISEPDLISWNAIITVYTQHGQGKEALKVFDQFWQAGIQPDKVSFISILSACTGKETLTNGKHIHQLILDSGFESDVVVATALIDMYGKCASVEDACSVFDKMHWRNVVSWNTMITVYAHDGQVKETLKLFDQMQQDGIGPDCVTFVSILSACANQAALAEGKQIHACILDSGYRQDIVINTAIVNMYGRCGSMENAQRTFGKMPGQSVVSWNSMIAVYAHHGLVDVAFELFEQMHAEGITPNETTFGHILAACSHVGLVNEARYYFDSMVQSYQISPDIGHYVCLVDLLSRAGQLDEAEGVINSMPVQPTSASFIALLGACRHKAEMQRGERVAEHTFELDPENAYPYVLLSNMYAAAAMEDDDDQFEGEWYVDASSLLPS